MYDRCIIVIQDMSSEYIPRAEDRGVSPVVGTIFMVAVVVILAAVIGAFVLDLGGSVTDSPPQAVISTEQGTQLIDDKQGTFASEQEYIVVTMTHKSGDDIDSDNIRVTVNGKPAYATLDPANKFYDLGSNAGHPDVLEPWASAESDAISSGDRTIIYAATDRIKNEGLIIDTNVIYINHLADGTAITLPGTEDLSKDEIELESGDTVRMIWESGDKSVQLAEHEI